jgi:hypothetical protein
VGHSIEKKSFKVDKDKAFKMIKIRVFKSGLIIERWVLEYTNGLFQHVGFVGFVPADKNYPPVQVNGKLKKIHFKYQSLQGQEKARIEVLGKE